MLLRLRLRKFCFRPSAARASLCCAKWACNEIRFW